MPWTRSSVDRRWAARCSIGIVAVAATASATQPVLNHVNPSSFSYVYVDDRCCAGALWTTGGRGEPDAEAGEMLEMWIAVGPDRLGHGQGRSDGVPLQVSDVWTDGERAD